MVYSVAMFEFIMIVIMTIVWSVTGFGIEKKYTPPKPKQTVGPTEPDRTIAEINKSISKNY